MGTATATGSTIPSTAAERHTATGRQPINLAVPRVGIQRAIVRLVLVRTPARPAAGAELEAPAISPRIAVPAAGVAPERIEAVEEQIASAIGKLQEVGSGGSGAFGGGGGGMSGASARSSSSRGSSSMGAAAVPAVAAEAAAAVAGDAGECHEPRIEGRTNEIENTEHQRLATLLQSSWCPHFFPFQPYFYTPHRNKNRRLPNQRKRIIPRRKQLLSL